MTFTQTAYNQRWVMLGILPATRLTVTCETCGHRHRLERRRTEPEMIQLVCHGCEMSLIAEFRPGADSI